MTNGEKLDLLLSQFKVMQDSMDKMQNDIVQIKGDIAENKSGIKALQEDVAENKSGIKALQRDVAENTSEIRALQRDVTDIRLTLENETNRNIMRVAEGHLDLSRKLDEAHKIDNEKEMMAIRLTIQENELRRLKDKVDQIA